jgi:hypothetical protein
MYFLLAYDEHQLLVLELAIYRGDIPLYCLLVYVETALDYRFE